MTMKQFMMTGIIKLREKAAPLTVFIGSKSGDKRKAERKFKGRKT